ncbi:DNA helicase II [Litorivicinus lipolyticus]|uniref:DNA helicase II n=1 Tax=Litorivicinus lipolyticus TaxID=418701 RepID=UPI003B58BAD1
MTHPLIEGLNPGQSDAVSAPESNLLVLAGAGSGKTRVLVHRVAWLMDVYEVSPYSIMAVTFTNKAAKEMQGRLQQLTQQPLRAMWVGTFHGLCHRWLRSHWQEAGLDQNFQVLDSDDQQKVVKRIIQRLNLDDKKFPPRTAVNFINSQKDEGCRAAHVQARGDYFNDRLIDIYATYEEECEAKGLVDFGELLLRAHETLRDNVELLNHYRARFQHILVDEFQDTNKVQYAWLRLLTGTSGHIMAVGDDDQSIYGWRGAQVENIRSFVQDFADVATVRLTRNYRSTANILNAANAVIDNNTGRMGKELWTEDNDGEPLKLYSAFNEQDEARFIADTVQRHVDDGNLRSDVAVLYRSNAQSRALEEAFLRSGVPYRIYGGQRFYERLEIKNALCYLRLILNRFDDVAFDRVVNIPPRGIGEKTLETVRHAARDQGMALWQAAKFCIESAALPARARTQLGAFLDLIDQLDSGTEGLELGDVTREVLGAAQLIEYHGAEKGEKARTRVENLKELASAMADFVPEEDENALAAFLAQASLDAGDRQADEHDDAVQMMTLHSAKGLEFPVVFLAGCEEGLFPHKMSMDDPDGLEEERRLAYVGITRAEKKLYLTHAETRRLYGMDSMSPRSRFLREIPPELIEEIRMNAKITRPLSASDGRLHRGAKRNDAPWISLDAGVDIGLSLGQRVEHRLFGEGVILKFEGSGPQTKVTVNFAGKGTKTLIAAYANLTGL